MGTTCGSKRSLVAEAAGVDGFSLAALEDDLAHRHAGVDDQRAPGDVRHLEDLAAVDAGRDEARRDVDHEAETRVAASTLQPPGHIGRKPDALARDRVDRLAGAEDVRVVEPLEARHRPVVRRLRDLDLLRSARHDADLVAEMEVDRSRSDLGAIERVDHQPAGRDFAQDDVACEDHRRASVAEPARWYRSGMRYEHVIVAANDGLVTVTMNRPERRNALSEAHMRELIAALSAAGDAPDTRAVVLAAAGPVFSAGHDFGDMVERDLDGMRRLLA